MGGARLGHSLDYGAVFEAVPRAIVVSDPSGTVLAWNPEAEQLYGWSASEALGRSVIDLLVPEGYTGDPADAVGDRLDAAAIETDRVVRRRDGSLRRIVSVARPVLDDSGETVALVGVSRDVTELRELEERERRLAEHFRLALDAGGLGTWRWDRAADERYWDPAMEALFGMAPGEFDGRTSTYLDSVHPEDRPAVVGQLRQAVDAKTSYRFEHRITRRDGAVRWLTGAGAVTLGPDGEVTGSIGCASDVTERVERELEHRRLELAAIEAADSERRQRERLEFVATINEALERAQTVEEVLDEVTRASVPRLGDGCAIHLTSTGGAIELTVSSHVDAHLAEAASDLLAAAAAGPASSFGVPRVLRTNEPELLAVIDDELIAVAPMSDAQRQLATMLGVRSVITVPLHRAGRAVGAMQFVMSTSGRHYTEDDLALAEAVAARISAGLENHRLHDQQRHIARILQRSLLPRTLPELAGIELAVRYWAAGEGTEVGGDFYDVFELSDDRWAVVIGDVCGTGPAAASLTGLARHSMRESSWHGDSPTEVLRSLNRAIRRSETRSFCTAAYAAVARTDGVVTMDVACGGHPPPIHVGRGGVHALESRGTLLGILPEIDVAETHVKLSPGDAVVFYTDGATDVAPPSGLSVDELASLIATVPARSAEELADGIHRILEERLPFRDRNDDLALLVLRVA